MNSAEVSRVVLAAWDFDDPAASRERFEDLVAVAQTQVARAHGLAGEFEQGHRVLDAVVGQGPRVALERGRLVRSAGDAEGAAPWFRQAYDEAVAAGQGGLAADAAHMLALVLPQEHEVWAGRGLAAAKGSDDPLAWAMTGALLNNLGWTLADEGRWDEAYAHFDEAVAVRQSVLDGVGGSAAAKSLHVARWTRARAAREIGRSVEALAELEALAATEIGAADPYVAQELEVHLANS